mmetsp:Transcript_51714/g.123892  ORF Transcript_51714/g.123892 Transcript_51714/m.123892 type:complete len:110 (+) Transcript_51714:478-807(+)
MTAVTAWNPAFAAMTCPASFFAPKGKLHNCVEGDDAVDKQNHRSHKPMDEVAKTADILLHSHVADGTAIDDKSNCKNAVLERKRCYSSILKLWTGEHCPSKRNRCRCCK